MRKKNNTHIAIVGLGYVGLPLAVAFAKAGFRVVGFDISQRRVEELTSSKDGTNEVPIRELRNKNLLYTTDAARIKEADFVIVAVPTPIYEETKKPDLRPLDGASEIIGKNIKRGVIVVYESTVWPGLTQEYCVPIIEKFSGKKCGQDFFIGYSPERINPGDKIHRLETIVKVVAGMDKKTLQKVSWLYKQVCKAGVFEAASIKVAEAAKVIENTQRDLNIALMNELSRIFQRVGISTWDVLKAAGTKWNFGKYTPGCVGGHCISVDPFYLTTLAQKLGYEPQVILAGRAINDSMPTYVASLLEEGLNERSKVKGQRSKISILVLGLTFKENVPDTRNSPARELIKILKEKGYTVAMHDPHVSRQEATRHFIGEYLEKLPRKANYDGVVITVAHQEFTELSYTKIKNLLRARHSFLDPRSFSEVCSEGGGSNEGVLVDVRGIFANLRPPRGLIYKTL